jgi:hypothetical protein
VLVRSFAEDIHLHSGCRIVLNDLLCGNQLYTFIKTTTFLPDVNKRRFINSPL